MSAGEAFPYFTKRKKMERFAKYLRCLIGFWIRLWMLSFFQKNFAVLRTLNGSTVFRTQSNIHIFSLFAPFSCWLFSKKKLYYIKALDTPLNNMRTFWPRCFVIIGLTKGFRKKLISLAPGRGSFSKGIQIWCYWIGLVIAFQVTYNKNKWEKNKINFFTRSFLRDSPEAIRRLPRK